MAYRLIAVDADGTLLTSALAVSDENKKALRYAADKGVSIVLCSGRSYKSLKMFAEETGLRGRGGYTVTFSGGAVYDARTDEMISSFMLGAGEARLFIKKIKEIAEQNAAIKDNFETMVYHRAESAYVERVSEYAVMYSKHARIDLDPVEDLEHSIDKDIFKILLAGDVPALKLIELELNKTAHDGASVFFSMSNLVEITNAAATKGAALKFVADRLGVAMSETIAIGDQNNDISMIQAAGLGVAMANAVSGVKAAAAYVTERTNDENGVAEAIYRFI